MVVMCYVDATENKNMRLWHFTFHAEHTFERINGGMERERERERGKNTKKKKKIYWYFEDYFCKEKKINSTSS